MTAVNRPGAGVFPVPASRRTRESPPPDPVAGSRESQTVSA